MQIYAAKFDDFDFYNFGSTKICTQAKLLRMVDFHRKKLVSGRLEQYLRYRFISLLFEK